MPERITGEEQTMAVSEAAPSPVLSVPPPTATPARHVFGARYEIVGLVGAGGMGTVYRARDKELDEVVALKLLRADLLNQPGMLERFRQEVKLARRVTHRNVARTYDIGECDGEKFLTMEFVEGEALSSRLARDGALPLDVVLTLTDGICAGLSAAHEAGIVHRDLKPDNVMIANDGRVVVTDFGIARALSGTESTATVGLTLGTPAYMAPEQVEGAKDLDARADIYALGAMLYECLVGAPAWSGDSVWSLASARLLKPPPDPRVRRADLPPSVAELVLRCMARRREDRFSSAKEITLLLAGMTRPAPTGSRTSRPPGVPFHASLETGAKTVAVLPFRNTGSVDDEYFAEGLSDDLVDALSMTPGLRVLAKGSVSRFKGPERDAREIGRELRVDVVVDGSLRRVGDVLRISARVVSVADGFQLWAKRFDRPEKEVLAVSDEAADAIAEALTLRRSAPARAVPTDAKALELYLRGRHAFRAGWRDKTLDALGFFEQALALAPNDPTILAGYANAQLRRFMFDTEASDAQQSEQKGREAAEKALALAPHLGEARAALANLAWMMGDPVACARELREAIRIAPSSTDVNELYGRVLLEAGEPQRGLAILAAAAALEPGLGLVATDLLRGRALLGDWSLFESMLDSMIQAPTAASQVGTPYAEGSTVPASYFLLARLCLWRRDGTSAARLRSYVASRPFGFQREVLGLLDVVERHRANREIEEALAGWGRIVSRARRRPILFRQLAAEVYAHKGDTEGIFRSMGEAEELGLVDLTWVDRCPAFEEVRALPAFAAVREKVAVRARATIDVLEWRELAA
jgi:eukaryotic-like serine/threonine-protein kinase